MNFIEALKLLKEGKAKYFGICNEHFKNIRIGIVTNKQDYLTYSLIMSYEFDDTGKIVDEYEIALTAEEILRDDYVILE